MSQVDHWVKESKISRPPPHPPSQHHHRTPNGSRTIQHSSQRGQPPFQDHQGGHVHLHAGPNPQQEPWEIPATSHMGPPPSGVTNLTSASLPAFQLHPPPNPLPLLVPKPSSHCPYCGGGTYFMVSTPVCPQYTPYIPNTPTPNLQQVLQQHHLGKFLTLYLLRPDEVASVWMPAKACHDFIMIILCFSTTRFYSSCTTFSFSWSPSTTAGVISFGPLGGT